MGPLLNEKKKEEKSYIGVEEAHVARLEYQIGIFYVL